MAPFRGKRYKRYGAGFLFFFSHLLLQKPHGLTSWQYVWLLSAPRLPHLGLLLILQNNILSPMRSKYIQQPKQKERKSLQELTCR
jgi:hypothetical protein